MKCVKRIEKVLILRAERISMEYLKATGKIITTESGNELLLKGVGLGGWLLPEGYMWKFYENCDRPRLMEQLILTQCSEEFSELFWRRYLEEYITEKDIEMISEWGFNSVRLPMNARTLCRKVEETLEFIPAVIEKIDQLIEWCKLKNIYVILDMHGAPGGQTGTNIDDCENNLPELFMKDENKKELIRIWEMLAIRYVDEPCVAGYDLINEPLPDWFNKYNGAILPLYKELVNAIRKYDKKHLIILEGTHWATDFSVFETLLYEIEDKNMMLQFHKYWNSPEKESIQGYLDWQERLQLPLFMGEGGENNSEWYFGMFQMLREANISYCFWSYKKMDTSNSLISFRLPKDWNKMIEVVKGKIDLSAEVALSIWADFLDSISDIKRSDKVANAIQGKAPVVIPAEYFIGCSIKNKRMEGAKLRESKPVTILYKYDTTVKRIPDYKRYGGEDQPKEEQLIIRLQKGDMIWYEFASEKEKHNIKIRCRFIEKDSLNIRINSKIGSNLIEIDSCEEWEEITCFSGELVEGDVKISILAKGIVDVETITIG